jgi:hypothetical protein
MKAFVVEAAQNEGPMGRSIMVRPNAVEVEIGKMIRDLRKRYRTNSSKIRKLKDRMNSLEEALSQENGSGHANLMRELNRTMRSLSELSDSLIIISERASQRIISLECKVRNSELEPNRLNDLRALRKKMELMAADLLCYTLGSFQHRALEGSNTSLDTAWNG